MLFALAEGVQATHRVDEVYVAQEVERLLPELPEVKREQLVELFLKLLAEEGRHYAV